ncbi:MAG: hypothetical protein R2702_07465 [Acidimicrobiales bacterium]
MAPTDEPGRAAGWALRTSREAIDLDGLLARFGQLHRIPIEPGPVADELAPGTPCFLVRTDRDRVVGLWAVGEVVAPTLALPAGTPLLPAEEPLGAIDPAGARCYAEVELLPLAKAIPLEVLLDDARLSRSELAGAADGTHRPLRLRAGEVRALESIEWWIDEPDDDQRRDLDRLLAAEDPLLDDLDAPDLDADGA